MNQEKILLQPGEAQKVREMRSKQQALTTSLSEQMKAAQQIYAQGAQELNALNDEFWNGLSEKYKLDLRIPYRLDPETLELTPEPAPVLVEGGSRRLSPKDGIVQFATDADVMDALASVTATEVGSEYELSDGSALRFSGRGGRLGHRSVRRLPGTTNEEVISVLIERLRYLQAKVPCEENKIIDRLLRAALWQLNERTRRRTVQGVEGTDKPHGVDEQRELPPNPAMAGTKTEEKPETERKEDGSDGLSGGAPAPSSPAPTSGGNASGDAQEGPPPNGIVTGTDRGPGLDTPENTGGGETASGVATDGAQSGGTGTAEIDADSASNVTERATGPSDSKPESGDGTTAERAEGATRGSDEHGKWEGEGGRPS